MIQLWLAKNATKLGIIGVIILIIFSCGFWTKSKLVRAKMDRMNTKYEQLERNYSIALEQNDNCYHNMSRLKESIASQNDAIIQLSNEAQKQLEEQKRMYEAALARERSSSAAAVRRINTEKEDLLRRVAMMTACDACNESFKELVR